MVIEKILASPSLWWDAHPSTPFDWEFLSLSRMRGSFLPSYQHPQYLPLRTVWCSSWVFLLPCLGSALGYFYMRERFGDFVLAWFFGFVFVFFLFSPPQLPSQGLPAKAGERHSGLPRLQPPLPSRAALCHPVSPRPSRAHATSRILGLILKEESPQALLLWQSALSKPDEKRSVSSKANEAQRPSTELSIQSLWPLASDGTTLSTGLHKALCN